MGNDKIAWRGGTKGVRSPLPYEVGEGLGMGCAFSQHRPHNIVQTSDAGGLWLTYEAEASSQPLHPSNWALCNGRLARSAYVVHQTRRYGASDVRKQKCG
jgi:hypothetical protein